MSRIIKDFEQKLAKEEVIGITEWICVYVLKDRYLLFEHIAQQKEKGVLFSPVQNTMISFVVFSFLITSRNILDLKEIGIAIPVLGEIEIQEVLTHYNLKNPTKIYQQIKSDIASPENFLTRIPYALIKELYEKGKVPFDREIFVACLIRFNVRHEGNFKGELAPELGEKIDYLFPKDEFTLDILMGVFEMELGVNGAFYLERELNIGGIILKLVKDGNLDKSKVQQKLFEAFNNPTLKQSTQTWVKNVYDKIQFSKEENLDFQSQLIELLHNDVNLVSNFGIKILKQISNQKTFDWSFFIDSLDGIIYRNKFIGGLKVVLKMLYQKLKKDNTLLEKVCVNLAPIFIQEDTSIQEEAVKIFMLLKEPNKDVTEALETFVSTMHSETKDTLASLLPNDDLFEIPYKKYIQKEYTPLSILELQKLEYINSEEDFIFLCTKVLKSENPLDYELFLEAILRFYHIKDTQKKALGSALKMAKKMTELLTNDRAIRTTKRLGIYHIFVAKLICVWLDSEELTLAEEIKNWKRVKPNQYPYNEIRILEYEKLFGHLTFIAENIRANNKIALLSTPTHTNGAIDVDVFFERLYVYEQNKITINESDFNTALNRLNRWSKYKNPKENNSEYREVLNYILNEKEIFDPKKIKGLEDSWLRAFILINQSKSTQAIEFSLTKKEKWWNAKAKDVFSFKRNHGNGYSYAYLESNFDYNRNDKQIVVLNTCYYLLNSGYNVADAYHWFFKDVYYLEPLYLSLTSGTGMDEKVLPEVAEFILKSLLESIKNPKPIGQNGIMYLCLNLFSIDTAIKNTALEWLIVLIENQYLNINMFTKCVGYIVSDEHHPYPMKRVSEQFEKLNQMSGVYVDILHQTLVEILKEINPEKLPKSFKNILHFYYETLKLTEAEIPIIIKEKLTIMLTKNPVKKEVKKILMIT